LVNPVRVQNSKVGTTFADTLLGSRFQRALIFQLVDTLVGRFAISGTLRDGPLAPSTSHANAIDNIALLGFVAETTSLVRA